MKKLPISLFMALSLVIFTTNCKKKDKDDDTEPTKTDVKQTDQSGSSEVDEAMDQVNDVINNKIGGGSNAGSRTAAYNLPCGIVSVDSSTTSGGYKVYKLNYGSNTKCGYKYKSGLISFSLTNGTKFSDAGAKFNTTFTDYTVEVRATGSIVTINGTISVENVDGGYVWQVITNSSTVIKHKVRGAVTITYSDGRERARHYFQMRTYSNASSGWGGLTLAVDGDSIAGVDNISETGKTYEGDYDFYTTISDPFTWSNCGTTYAGPYVLKEGNAKMNVVVPLVTAYIQVEAGYEWDVNNLNSTPTKVNSCSSNAYKIDVVIGPNTSTSYQLY